MIHLKIIQPLSPMENENILPHPSYLTDLFQDAASRTMLQLVADRHTHTHTHTHTHPIILATTDIKNYMNH